MNVGNVAVGVGLSVWGVVGYAFARWWVGDDARLRRAAKRNWWLDRRLQGRIRRREMTQWFAEWVRHQRATVKWAFTPFLVVWLVLCVGQVVHGVTTR